MTDTFVGGDGGADDMDLDVLSGYLDDELTPTERAAVEARLAASPEWRAELDAVASARLAVRGLPEREAPAGFWDDVLATVAAADVEDDVSVADPEAGEQPVAAPIPLAPRRNRRMLWIASAAAAVVALVTAVVVIPQRDSVRPNVAAVIAQHGAQSSNSGDPISSLAPVGPFAGFRR